MRKKGAKSDGWCSETFNSLVYVVASPWIHSFLMKTNSEEMTGETITSLLYVFHTSVTERTHELNLRRQDMKGRETTTTTTTT